MKCLFILFTILISSNVFSQNARIQVVFENQEIKRALFLVRPLNSIQIEAINDKEVFVFENGTFTKSLIINVPEIMYLTSYVNDSLEFKQPIFLKNGYDLQIDYKIKKGKPEITTKGIGAEDNQPWVLNSDISFDGYNSDTLPDNFTNYIKAVSNKNKLAVQNYIIKNNPTSNFVNSWELELQYNPVKAFYIFSNQRLLFVRDAYERNKEKWHSQLNKLLEDAPLMNESAFNTTAYRLFIKMVLIFNKPHATASKETEEIFIKNWYSTEQDTGARSFYKDKINIPNQKTIEKYFKGNAKEFLYAHLFKTALESGNLLNVDSIYKDFCNQYPHSEYKNIFDVPLNTIFNTNYINKKIIYESNKIETWEELLTLFKGKTVLLDMWGTWCSPCREAIKNYSFDIKKRFKDKDLEFLYIANNDEKNMQRWKNLITYFKIEGHHILANKAFTEDVKRNIKLEAYPTYVIIHKNGTFEVVENGLETLESRKELFAKLEKALEE